MLANFSGEELTVSKATVLGVAEEISEDLVDNKCRESQTRTVRLNHRESERTSYCITVITGEVGPSET